MDPDPGALSDTPPSALDDLVGGRWSRWPAMAGMTVHAVEAAWGAALDPEPKGGVFGGSPTLFRRWVPEPDAGPVTVWFEDEVVVGIQIDQAVRATDDAPLPPPDEVFASGLGDRFRQCVWGDRGLAIHTEDAADQPSTAALLLAVAPFSTEDWAADPLRWWGSRRRRR